MKIAVINETSAAAKNADVLAALEGRGHEIINAGMTEPGATPEMTYIHTGLLSALLLNTGRVDFVVGGCGTGQGYLNSVLQYPNVGCGLIQTPLDAWLFGQIDLKQTHYPEIQRNHLQYSIEQLHYYLIHPKKRKELLYLGQTPRSDEFFSTHP